MSNMNLQINMPSLLINLSTSLDFSRQGITDHHKRVATLSLKLAQAAKMNSHELLTVFQSAIIHDIGAINWQEKTSLTEFDVATPHHHCIIGSDLVAGTKTLASVDSIIRCHHDNWKGNNDSGLVGSSIPLHSRIIHLADRLDVLIRPEVHILGQRQHILERIHKSSGTAFDPDLIDLLTEISKHESFWLELVSPWWDESLAALPLWEPVLIGIDDLIDISNLFARVIDLKSPFTHRHSHGVSMVASLLAQQDGMSEPEIRLMAVAGLLHDIGKLSVPDQILEKPGRLTESEFYWIKQHTYYTYKILQPLAPATKIPQWAAYHHEKLNGQGYPFGLSAAQIDRPARIVAVADMFTALHEDRPYRPGLSWDEIMKLLRAEAQKGGLDSEICALLGDSRAEIELNWALL